MEYTIEDVKWPKVHFDNIEPRKEGLHLTDVVRSIIDRSSSFRGKGKGFTDIELTAEIGLLWERVFSLVYRDKFAVRIPQLQLDGIWMSPDGVDSDPLDEVPLVVAELKCTWKSSRSTLIDNFYYMAQVKSYCYALETNVAIMHVLYLMGDYRGSGPLYRTARIRFTDWELEENWTQILNEKERMGR